VLIEKIFFSGYWWRRQEKPSLTWNLNLIHQYFRAWQPDIKYSKGRNKMDFYLGQMRKIRVAVQLQTQDSSGLKNDLL